MAVEPTNEAERDTLTRLDVGNDARHGETIDGATGLPDPPPQGEESNGKGRRRIDLATLRDVRIEMGHVYRGLDAGDIEPADGTKRIYILRNIADVITIAEIEKRLEDLELRQLPGGRPALRAVNTRS